MVGLPITSCAVCRCEMLAVNHDEPVPALKKLGHARFPENSLMAQLGRAEFPFQSRFLAEGKPVCVPCAEAKKARFRCFNCDVERPSDQCHVSIGDTMEADHLCTTCYGTVSAARWESMLRTLITKHTNEGVY